MKYAVDRIIDNIAILENIDTKEKLEININDLPFKVKEKNILIYKDNKFIIDEEEEKIRTKRITDKLNKLKNLDQIKRG